MKHIHTFGEFLNEGTLIHESTEVNENDLKMTLEQIHLKDLMEYILDVYDRSDYESLEYKIGKKLNITCMKRSEKNSQDTSTTDDALLETLSNYKNKYEFIVILQVTSPLRKILTLKSFVNYCLKNKIKCCLTVSEILENLSNPSNLFFSPLKKKRIRTQDKKPFLLENGLIYFISKKEFFKNKIMFGKKKWKIFVTDKYESIDINNKQDYNVCKKLYLNK
jgi:CMP-N-acetylneuraminic acid synthetase